MSTYVFSPFPFPFRGPVAIGTVYPFPDRMSKMDHSRRSEPGPSLTGPPPRDPVAMTRRLVRTPSVNPVLEKGGAGEERIARLVGGWLSGWGYATRTIEVAPGRYNVVGRLGAGSGPVLLLNGHLDTVGVGGMTDPFSGSVRRGRLYGRGAADMKAGVACILATAARLASAEVSGELVVALTADEEHASLGMEALVADGIRADAAVVCEPTGLAVMPAHKGFLWIDAHVAGRAAHGSRADLGIDAITRAAHLLAAFEAEGKRLARDTGHPLLGPASVHAGTISGGSAPSVYPESCHVVFERRTLPGETAAKVMREAETVLAEARRCCRDLEARLEPGLFRAASEVPAAAAPVQELLGACTRAGLPGEVAGMSAWVDACLLNESGTPAVCFGPGSIAQAHAADEWVEVSEINTCADVLTDFCRRLVA